MGWKRILVLLVVVGSMVAFLWSRGSSPPDGGGSDPKKVLTTKLLSASMWTAHEVRMRRAPNLPTMILGLDAATGRFLITDPVRDTASMAELTSIFRIYDEAELLPGFSAEELAADPTRIAKVGLDKPRAEVEVRYADRTVKIEIGDSGFREDETYVRVDGAVKRAQTTLFTAIQKNPDELRERVLFTDLLIGAPQKIRLTRTVDGRRQVDAIEHDPRRGFRITEPKSLRPDMHMVEGLVKEIGALRIERFVSGAANPTFGDEPALVLQVVGDRGADTLEVGSLTADPAQGKGLVIGRLKGRNVVFHLRGYGLARLIQWADRLRAKHLLSLPSESIQRVELDPGVGSQAVVLVRAMTQSFRLERPIKADVQAKTVSEVLDALTRLEARQFVDEIPAEAGLGDDGGFFAVRVGTRAEGGSMQEIRIGRPAGDGLVYARRTDESTAVLLPAEVVAFLRRPWIEFVSKVAVPTLPQAAWGLAVLAPGKDERFWFKQEGAWREEGATTDTPEVQELIENDLSGLRAARVFPRSVVDGQTPIRLRLMQGRDRGNYFMELEFFRHEEGVLVAVKGRSEAVVYLVKALVFRHLYDAWK